jgi:hypothetical protein
MTYGEIFASFYQSPLHAFLAGVLVGAWLAWGTVLIARWRGRIRITR